MSMLANFGVPISPHAAPLSTLMAKTFCVINPIVYFVCFKRYRVPLKELFGLESTYS
jgi:hypothetical protein